MWVWAQELGGHRKSVTLSEGWILKGALRKFHFQRTFAVEAGLAHDRLWTRRSTLESLNVPEAEQGKLPEESSIAMDHHRHCGPGLLESAVLLTRVVLAGSCQALRAAASNAAQDAGAVPDPAVRTRSAQAH
ncbi:unnamed protein product [Rangifer tarandus platyrhynchus]|uniref:Uncharacterized protein n=1 Tax=Rangifer tarandus platyrhynchus TaxID=3082113 RepID=A0ABN8ZWY4_RANTA|nr:unnamed protein product [Rangifer tarandus platyrhynchus]